MSNTIRIRTTPNGNDKYLKVNLTQDFDFVEILSLNISQEDVYRQFCSDYGVIVGRVIVNSGFGVPNAKVSVFIPIDDVDKENPTIRELYPYEIVTDKDSNGVRYNLLPKESETNNDCFTPVGTFPTKREVLDNEVLSEIYCKYYKFTTTTNYAGDFMIFGVPVGTYTVHVDADVSDIGTLSQRPYDLIRQGTPVKLFDGSTKFKSSTNLDKLPQIKTANIGVNVQPFWGDLESCQIGITRVDVDLNYTVQTSAIFMGSIFGDQDKNSVNKNCRPRKELGELCQQITSQGSIEMIRRTVDGETEQFDVDGGRVIDDDGVWAFQVPMNLDYVVTSEDGTVIPSADPNIGVPTRARVRFRIGMDETGGEGRLRTRAKYLVPNNPQSPNEIDYSFGEETVKEASFVDLYWNKIYSVSSFIPRYQSLNLPSTRSFTGIKNVDACVGDKNPFPYNRVDTEGNPIFTFLCSIITIIVSIVSLINFAIIGAINGIIDAVNGLIPGEALDLPLVPCVSIACPTESGSVDYSPGCNPNNTQNPTTGLADCLSFSLANSLNMYQFDFYNDWINGSLYAFLLKYKKRRKGNEKFCEYDCGDFVGDPNYSGVDENGNGEPDNDCNKQNLYDTLYPVISENNCQNRFTHKSGIKEGLIKKLDDNFYYASSTSGQVPHGTNYRLFATDIICLGSVFECDWQGVPKLQSYLTPTTYKLPPEVQEVVNGQLIETGMVSFGQDNGQLFSIDCFGLHVNATQALNMRHICEVFVDTDSAVEGPNNTIAAQANGVIGSNEISEIGRFFRDTFTYLNSGSTDLNNYNPPSTLSTDFNTGDTVFYDFTGIGNGTDYLNFRGYFPPYNNTYNSYRQPKHSYFMYFGLVPGKTAVDKLSQNYFTICPPKKIKDVLLLDATSTPDFDNNFSGTITFTFIGGQGPYNYTVTFPDGSEVSGSVPSINPTEFLNNLGVGVYTIFGVDSLGYTVTQTVIVAGPTPLTCDVSVIQNASSPSALDGQISIDVYGGQQPYSYELSNNAGLISSGTLTSLPLIIDTLGFDNILGYSVVVTDDNGDTCVTDNLIVSVDGALSVNATTTANTCYFGDEGSITLNIFGGTQPYTITTTGPNGFFNQNSVVLDSLISGVYVTTIIDGNGDSVVLTTTVPSEYPPLEATIQTSFSNGSYTHIITASGGAGDFTASPYSVDSNGIGVISNSQEQTITTTITDGVGCQITVTG
jgi:hypothetical protein